MILYEFICFCLWLNPLLGNTVVSVPEANPSVLIPFHSLFSGPKGRSQPPPQPSDTSFTPSARPLRRQAFATRLSQPRQFGLGARQLAVGLGD